MNEQARIVGFLTFYALDNPRFVNEFARQLQRIMSSDLDDQSRNSVKIAGLQYLRHTSLFGKMDMSIKVVKTLLSEDFKELLNFEDLNSLLTSTRLLIGDDDVALLNRL